jgi:hypothetical protein
MDWLLGPTFSRRPFKSVIIMVIVPRSSSGKELDEIGIGKTEYMGGSDYWRQPFSGH